MREQINGLIDFSRFMEEIIHDGALPLYQNKKEYPVTIESLSECVLESICFYDRFIQLPLSVDQLESFGFVMDSVSDGFKRMEYYQAVEDDTVLDLYLERLCMIIKEQAKALSPRGCYVYPNYHSYKGKILAYFASKPSENDLIAQNNNKKHSTKPRYCK